MASARLSLLFFLCAVNSIVLWSFTFMLWSGNYTFAVLAAKNEWDKGLKTATCRNAAIGYLCLAIGFLILALVDTFVVNIGAVFGEIRCSLRERRAPAGSRMLRESVFGKYAASSRAGTAVVIMNDADVATSNSSSTNNNNSSGAEARDNVNTDTRVAVSVLHEGPRARQVRRWPRRDYLAEVAAENAEYYSLRQFGQDYIVAPSLRLWARLRHHSQNNNNNSNNTSAGAGDGVGGGESHTTRAEAVTIVALETAEPTQAGTAEEAAAKSPAGAAQAAALPPPTAPSNNIS